MTSRNVPQIMKQGKLTPWLYLLPALVVMSFFIVYPMFNTISLSFLNKDGTASAATTCQADQPCWGVFENYHYALTAEFDTSSPQALWSSFWSSSYGNTLKWIVFMVGGTVSVGLGFGYIVCWCRCYLEIRVRLWHPTSPDRFVEFNYHLVRWAAGCVVIHSTNQHFCHHCCRNMDLVWFLHDHPFRCA